MIVARTKVAFFLLMVIFQGAVFMVWYNQCQDNQLAPAKRPNSQVAVLILSSWRSGSSFVGQVFSQHPDVFYLIEPPYHVWKLVKSNKPQKLRMAVRDQLRSLFHCDLSVMQSYLEEKTNASSLFRFTDSRAMCSPPGCPAIPSNQTTNSALCIKLCGTMSLSHVEKICSSHSHVVLKVVRIFELESLFPLFKDSNLDFRIIHLFRDPRAMEQSREKQNYSKMPEQVMTLPYICRSHVRISETALLNPPPFLKGRYKVVRYEDIVRDPLDEINSMFEFVGLKLTQQYAHWIYKLTHGNKKEFSEVDAYDTGSRDAVEISDFWRNKLSYSDVQKVQKQCKVAMSLLGYKPVNSFEELRDSDINLLLPMKLPEEKYSKGYPVVKDQEQEEKSSENPIFTQV